MVLFHWRILSLPVLPGSLSFGFLKGYAYLFPISTPFDYSSVALPKLTVLEKDNLRHLNSFYLTIDKLLDGFDESFKNDIDNWQTRQNTLESVYKPAVIQLKDIRESLSSSLNISSNFLKGKPLTIFSEEKGRDRNAARACLGQ